MESTSVRALFFDAGHTLVYPTTGNWFIPPRFVEFFSDQLTKENTLEDINSSFRAAYAFLDENHNVQTEEQEFEQFCEFYRQALDGLHVPSSAPGLHREIAHDTVFNTEKFGIYEDVVPSLIQFSQTYELAVVSDTWPSLERVFRELGMLDYFSSFIMSSVLGVSKPHQLMFHTPLSELALQPAEACFVDDSAANTDAAHSLGLHAVQINRGDVKTISEIVPCISGLEELLPILN